MPKPPLGRADFLDLGNWNAQCSMCARKRKGSDLVQNWQGLWRCPEHNEPRQPQDFVRGVPDDQLPPFVQVNTYQFRYFCDPNAISAYSGYGVVDCTIVDFISPAFNPDIPPGD